MGDLVTMIYPLFLTTSWYGKDREYLASTKNRKIARLIQKDGNKGLVLHAVWTTRSDFAVKK